MVAPLEKSKLLAGKGHFYPPDKKIFAVTFVAARRGCLTLGERRYQVMRGGEWRNAVLTALNPDGTVGAEVSDSDLSKVEVQDLPRTKIRESSREKSKAVRWAAEGCKA